MDPLIANSEVRPVEWRRSTRKDQPSPGHRDRRRFGHPLPKGEGLDFGHLGSSHFGDLYAECLALVLYCWY